jgi:hypothetical protein
MNVGQKIMASNSPKVLTYVESGVPDLEAAPRVRLLFAAWFSHGPGFQENLLFFVGPSKCKRYDVLWQESDWNDDGGKSGRASLPRKRSRNRCTRGGWRRMRTLPLKSALLPPAVFTCYRSRSRPMASKEYSFTNSFHLRGKNERGQRLRT